MVNLRPEEARKALVVVAVESVLLKMGKPVYDEVIFHLQKNYHCYLPDCYEHPEYLKKIIQDLFGRSFTTIIQDIQNQLGEYVEQKGIDTFIAVISG